MPTRSAVDDIGSRVGGSPIVATLITPPFSWARRVEGKAISAAPSSNATRFFIQVSRLVVPLLCHVYFYKRIQNEWGMSIAFARQPERQPAAMGQNAPAGLPPNAAMVLFGMR